MTVQATGTHLLTLPAEIRLRIYFYLQSPVFNLDLCRNRLVSRLANSTADRKQSPILKYLKDRNIAAEWTRNHGLHLSATCSLLGEEYLALLRESESYLIIHCSACLKKWQYHLRRDLGVKNPLLVDIRCRVDFSIVNNTIWHHAGPWHARSKVGALENAIHDLKEVVNHLYGPSNLLDLDESTDMHKSRLWNIHRIKIIGMVPRVGCETNASDLSLDNNDDDIDDDRHFVAAGGTQGAFVSRRYATLQGVEELDSQTKCWDISNPKSGDWQKIREMIEMCSPAGAHEWRRSLAVQLDWKGKGRSRLVCREEIWIRVRLNVS